MVVITEEILKLIPPSKLSYIRSMMGTHPEAAAREVENILGAHMPRERKPLVLLDENVAFLNFPLDDIFPLKVVQRLKAKGIEATFVGDKRKFEGLEEKMWAKSPTELEVFKVMDKCHAIVSTGKYRDKELRTPAQVNKAFKNCVYEGSSVMSGNRIQGFHQVPPKESSDVYIGKWADENGILVISFDADPGLEGKELGDRIRLEQTGIECVVGKPQLNKRLCGSSEEEADKMANLIIRRMAKVRDLLKGQY